MAGLKDWFPVFRAGEQTDSSGNKHSFTVDDLDKIVEKYQPTVENFQEAPVVVGHPKNDDPAFGWIEALKREGNTLFAKCKDVVEEFEESVKKGLYPYRSIALRPDLTIRHIGFLGAVQPAVKGLGRIAFSGDEEQMTFEFADAETRDKFESIGIVFQRLRELLIDKFDIETADKAIGSWLVEDLKNIDYENEKAVEAFCEKFMEDIALKTKETEGKAQEFSQADAEAKDKRIADLEAQNEKMQAEAREKEFASFCDELEKEGKLVPAQRKQTLDFMQIMHSAGEFEFSEGGNQSAVENFKKFLKSLPKQVEFNELAKGDVQEDGEKGADAIAKAALEYQSEQAEKGITIRIDEAVRHVSKKQ